MLREKDIAIELNVKSLFTNAICGIWKKRNPYFCLKAGRRRKKWNVLIAEVR